MDKTLLRIAFDKIECWSALKIFCTFIFPKCAYAMHCLVNNRLVIKMEENLKKKMNNLLSNYPLRLSNMSSWSLDFLDLSIRLLNCSFKTSHPTSTHFRPSWDSAHCFNLISTVVLKVPENNNEIRNSY